MFFLGALLYSEAFSASSEFIQNSIAPSYKNKSYFYDTDGDGRMDQITIPFIAKISKNYLKENIDSLVLNWPDVNGNIISVTVTQERMRVESRDEHVVVFDLKNKQKHFKQITSLDKKSGTDMSRARLYYARGESVEVIVNDKMAPTIVSAHLKSYRENGRDTLKVKMSEPVHVVEGCENFLEYKRTNSLYVELLSILSVSWNGSKTDAVIELGQSLADAPLGMSDSIRIASSCIRDSVRNKVNETSFVPVKRFFPLEVHYNNMILDERDDFDNEDIFEIVFGDALDDEDDLLWNVSIDVLGLEFENAVRANLKLDENEKLDLKKLKFKFKVGIYTNIGAYVAGSSVYVRGDDARFCRYATRLGLRWNLIDERHRRVSTGVYVAKAVIMIEYKNEIVYRSDMDDGVNVYSFGVVRR